MTRNTYEITLKSGAKVQFKAKAVTAVPGSIKWTRFNDQSALDLLHVAPDQIAAVVRLA